MKYNSDMLKVIELFQISTSLLHACNLSWTDIFDLVIGKIQK